MFQEPLKRPCQCVCVCACVHRTVRKQVRDGAALRLPACGPGQGHQPLPCPKFTFAIQCCCNLPWAQATIHGCTLRVLECLQGWSGVAYLPWQLGLAQLPSVPGCGPPESSSSKFQVFMFQDEVPNPSLELRTLATSALSAYISAWLLVWPQTLNPEH